MKRIDLIRHAEFFNCRILREGARHTVLTNLATGRMSAIPRHNEIDEFLARKICKDFGIPKK